MQAASDIMLDWDRITGIDGDVRDFYVRQLWDAKGSALIDAMEPNVFESSERSEVHADCKPMHWGV